jgi:hypothetical protein
MTLTPGPVPSNTGIFWGLAVYAYGIQNDYGSSVPFSTGTLALLVNGNPEATDGVTLTAPGYSSPLPYAGTTIINGTTYALYEISNDTLSVTFSAGNSVTLESVTSIGTASATVVLPGGASIASDGSQASWTNPGETSAIVVSALGVGNTYQISNCSGVANPALIPSSAYPMTNNYGISANTANLTTSITGGTGIFIAGETYNLEALL